MNSSPIVKLPYRYQAKAGRSNSHVTLGLQSSRSALFTEESEASMTKVAITSVKASNGPFVSINSAIIPQNV
jgi:hypothetical protein